MIEATYGSKQRRYLDRCQREEYESAHVCDEAPGCQIMRFALQGKHTVFYVCDDVKECECRLLTVTYASDSQRLLLRCTATAHASRKQASKGSNAQQTAIHVL